MASAGSYAKQTCTMTQTHNHASIPPLKFFTGQMPFLLPNQQHQITAGNLGRSDNKIYF